MSQLNTRQWRLYNKLKDCGDVWTKQCELAQLLPDLYPCDDLQTFHDSASRILMTNDISKLNKSDVVQKIIISNRRGVKLANKEEAWAFIESKYIAVFKSLKKVRKMECKAGLDGQARLVFGRERPIIQSFLQDEETAPDYL